MNRLMRWCFERLYREFAWSYDLVAAAVSLGRWNAWAAAALAYAAPPTLELGCGPGHLQRRLLGTGGAVGAVGVDRSRQMLRRARRNAPGALLVCADARALPFAGPHFASVLATFPAEYIADAATAAEIRRVLLPGGAAAVVVWAEMGRARAADGAGPTVHRRVLAHLAGAGLAAAYRPTEVAGATVHMIVAERAYAADAG